MKRTKKEVEKLKGIIKNETPKNEKKEVKEMKKLKSLKSKRD